MAQWFRLDFGVKYTQAPIEKQWFPKNRIFGGYFDQQNNQILTKNTHSPILKTNNGKTIGIDEYNKV
jgi:hypothetical protein